MATVAGESDPERKLVPCFDPIHSSPILSKFLSPEMENLVVLAAGFLPGLAFGFWILKGVLNFAGFE